MNNSRDLPLEQLSPPQQQQLHDGLRQLLAQQIQGYTRDESCSVRVETARELLASLSYTLGLAAADAQLSPQQLVSADLGSLLRQGQQLLLARLEQTRQRWRQVCLCAPKLDNVYYRDSLRAIGSWFDHYDLCYMAHLPPANIDYPLLRPIDEGLIGLSYVAAWLQQLYAENRLLACFDPIRVSRVLQATAGDWHCNYINLCEPALVNALGRVLLERPPQQLTLDAAARAQLLQQLPHGRALQLRQELEQAAQRLGRQLRLEQDAAALSCLQQLAKELAPRLLAALKTGDLSQVFVS